MKVSLVLCFTAVVWAQNGLDRSRLGMMLSPEGTIHPVFGISGSVTLGDPGGAGVLSVACSGATCLVKTRTAIVSNGQEIDAPVGPALFAFGGNSAFVYFPLMRRLARLKDGRLDSVPVVISGQVLSLRVRDSGKLEFAVRRNQAAWIVNSEDQPVDSIPSDAGPVMLLADGVVCASSTEAILRRDDASELRFPVAGAESFSALGDGYVQVRSGRTSYAIRTTRGHERMFQLPEPAP